VWVNCKTNKNDKTNKKNTQKEKTQKNPLAGFFKNTSLSASHKQLSSVAVMHRIIAMPRGTQFDCLL